jgi:hypothetical protein
MKKQKTKWIDRFRHDLYELNFNIEEVISGSVSMIIASNIYFKIRAIQKNLKFPYGITIDIAVRKNFDRWANSTDWFINSKEEVSAKALVKVINRFYKQHYFNPAYSDYLDITSNVKTIQECMNYE